VIQIEKFALDLAAWVGEFLDHHTSESRGLSPSDHAPIGARPEYHHIAGRKEKEMSNETVTRFFGGSPARVVIQLVVLSFFLGLVLHALGVSPYDIVNGLRDLARRIYDMGFDTVGVVVRYILLGAVIVVPIWLILRLTRVGRRSG
jgi:hypothetical protein